jgi:hypothetical protein
MWYPLSNRREDSVKTLQNWEQRRRFPHLDHEMLPDNSMAGAERWAANLSAPGYAIDDVTHYSLLITHYSLLITHYSLLITHYSLLITHYSLLITHYSLQSFFYAMSHFPFFRSE